MAGTENLEEAMLKIRLLVDKKKNKVVLAAVGKDFVDVLFSFLALPMRTIVRLLEKYQRNQKSQAIRIGCFNNLYGSVRNMDTNDFLTEACKHALLNTRGVKEEQCRQLKINIDDNEVLKFYMCSGSESGFHSYSNFGHLKCSCGSLMGKKFNGKVRNYEFFDSKNNSFIVTDNMEVEPASVSLTFKTIRGLGYADADNLQEILVDADHEKVLALLESLFSSDTPLTDVFSRNQGSYAISRTKNMTSLIMQEAVKAKSNEVLSVKVFVRKQDGKVLYAESKEDFVDLLFTFFAFPLESVWKLAGSNIVFGCIGKLCKSIKRLSEETTPDTDRFTLHWHYSVPQPLFDICYMHNLRDSKLFNYTVTSSSQTLEPMHPNGSLVLENRCSKGFVKGGQTYMISDDLTITSPIFCMLKKLETELVDVEEHVINISRAESLTYDFQCLNHCSRFLNPKEA